MLLMGYTNMDNLKSAFVLIWIIFGVECADIKKCFSNVVCSGDKSSRYLMKQVQVYPFPDCCGKYSEGINTRVQKLNTSFSVRIQQFRQELDPTTNVTKQPEVNTEDDTCFAPVICDGVSNWMQVLPILSCYLNQTDDYDTKKIPGLLVQYSNEAAEILKDAISERCGNCALTSPTITRELERIKATSVQKANSKTCFGPVFCIGEVEFVEYNWMRLSSPPEKSGKIPVEVNELSGENEMKALDESLKQSIQVFKAFTDIGCGSCLSPTNAGLGSTILSTSAP